MNMHVAIFVTVVAIVVGFAAPTCANDRSSDPFGNYTINLLINAAPGYLTGPLEVITVRDGDCKSHSIAKYAAARAAGFSADHVRLVTVHDRRHNFDHMVATVYYNEEWLILDNLTNLLVRDTDKTDYAPMVILDYKCVRRYHSAFWTID